ncbi:MAG: hypothetical protein RLZZ370_148 [Bacteroidota bacterium]
MPQIHPLKIIRPDFSFASQVSARISGSETQDELTQVLEGNPFSYLHVVKPYLHFADPEHQERHFGFGRNYFRQLQDQKILIEEPVRQIMIYRQSDPAQGIFYEGILAGVAVADYLNGSVKKHEHTRTQKELKLVKHMEVTHAVGEPVLICYESAQKKVPLESWKGDIFCDFVCESGLQHQVWSIPETLHQNVQEYFAEIPAFYIADGHHRIAATARYFQGTEHKSESLEDQTFMSMILPAEQMTIKSFHRLIHWPLVHDIDEFLQQLSLKFTFVKSFTEVKPSNRGSFGLCINTSEWFSLTLKEEYRPAHYPEGLDVSCLEQYIFQEILNITDSKTDERLTFSRGDLYGSGLSELMQVHQANLTFTLFHNTFDEVKKVADEHGVMPPKSTWIEPKMRTGMIIQRF